MCYQASALREKCKLAEIAVRLKIGGGQEGFIAEQVEALRKIRDEAFHHDTIRHIEEHYAPLMEKAKKIADSKKIPVLSGNVNTEVSNIQHRKDSIIEKIDGEENSDNLAEKVLLFLTKPQETLVLLGDSPDSERVFVRDDGLEAEEISENS